MYIYGHRKGRGYRYNASETMQNVDAKCRCSNLKVLTIHSDVTTLVALEDSAGADVARDQVTNDDIELDRSASCMLALDTRVAGDLTHFQQ